jgi:hypothetical protein
VRDWKYIDLHLKCTGNETGEEAATPGTVLKKLLSFRFQSSLLCELLGDLHETLLSFRRRICLLVRRTDVLRE